MDFWLEAERLISTRYLNGENGQPYLQLRFNFPGSLGNMMEFTFNYRGSYDYFRETLLQLLDRFEQPEVCQGR